MKVSFNEITVMCKKAFEGLGFNDGDYEDIAYMIAWSELHGLDGLVELKKMFSALNLETIKPITLIYQDDNVIAADNHHQSVLLHGASICDAIDARSQRRGLATLRLLNCQNRKLLLGYLAKCAMRKNNITAVWQASTKLGVVAIFNANHRLPEIHYYDTDEVHMNFPKACSMNIIFSQQVKFAFPEYETVYAKLNLVSKDDGMQTSMKRALDEGIEVDSELWLYLKKEAAKILVESSEVSRKGAG